MDLIGECILSSEDLPVLGYRFNVFLNFSTHVRYWLDRGLGVRKRIAALGRRYGSVGGLGAWETYRLVQAAYLPTVYYGLEFVSDYRSYVKQIQIHVNDCLRSVFRAPIKLANNILLAEYGVAPVAIQGRYLQRRCYSWLINYRYCDEHPWFGQVRSDWDVEGMVAHRQTSEKVLGQRPRVTVGKGKEVIAARHRLLFKELSSSSDLVVYTDRSKTSEGAGAAWAVFVRGKVTGAGGCAVPPSWSVVECELCT